MKLEGLEVVDAVRPLIIDIEDADCKKGKKKSPGACAAAVAIIREVGAIEARVHLGRTYVKKKFKGKEIWERYMTPPAISREMTAFDRGAAFEPGTYKFRHPAKTAKLGYRLEGGPQNKRPRNGKRPVHHLTTNVRNAVGVART